MPYNFTNYIREIRQGLKRHGVTMQELSEEYYDFIVDEAIKFDGDGINSTTAYCLILVKIRIKRAEKLNGNAL